MKPNKLDQYKRLLEATLDGKLGAMHKSRCVYSHGKRRCAVGFLFTEAQIADIKARGLNLDTTVHLLAWYIGENNIVEVTGLSLVELANLQAAHDESPERLAGIKRERAKTSLVRHLRKAIEELK